VALLLARLARQARCAIEPPLCRLAASSRGRRHRYAVSDGRVNIGTSNWQWGYFHNTAGASLNTADPSLVAAAQAVFDADWDSAYAVPLDY
jgi:phospholipase D3/4